MIYYGILLAIIMATVNGIDTVLNKICLKKLNGINHTFVRLITLLPVLLIIALFNWKIDLNSWPLLLLYTLLELINIVCHLCSVKIIDPTANEIVSKSKIIFVYLLGLILATEIFNVIDLIGIIIFVFAIYLTVDFSKLKKKGNSGFKGYALEFISCLARTFKPFVIAKLLSSNTISNEVVVFLSMLITALIILILYRPKINYKELNYKIYFTQSLLVAISMLSYGYAVLFCGVLLTSMIENLSIISTCISVYFIYKEKVSIKTIIASVLCIAGILLIL